MKMLKNKIINFLAIIALIAVTSCAGKPVNFSYDQSHIDIKKVDFSRPRDISISASGFQLILFIPIGVNSRHDRAYRHLRRQVGPNYYITDIRIQESWKYAFIGNIYTTRMYATAYPIKGRRRGRDRYYDNYDDYDYDRKYHRRYN